MRNYLIFILLMALQVTAFSQVETPNEKGYSNELIQEFTELKDKLIEQAQKNNSKLKLLNHKMKREEDKIKNQAYKKEIKSISKEQNKIESDIATLQLMYNRNKSEKRIKSTIDKINEKYYPTLITNQEFAQNDVDVDPSMQNSAEDETDKQRKTKKKSKKENESYINENSIEEKKARKEKKIKDKNKKTEAVSVKTKKKNSSELAELNKKVSVDEVILPEHECKVQFDGVDPNNLMARIDMKAEPFFFYTHPKLKKFYKDNSFLTASSNITKIGKKKYINFNILIRSRDAEKTYGFIQSKSSLKITLINGSNLYLRSSNQAEGKIEQGTGFTRYIVLYEIPKQDYKDLSIYEIDKVGFMWSTGYEVYEVFNLDLLKNQINCLEKL